MNIEKVRSEVEQEIARVATFSLPEPKPMPKFAAPKMEAGLPPPSQLLA